MSSSTAHTKRQLKRSNTKKSHSWWWDSHISPKNSRWLADNLQQMDDRVNRMLKLIEEDADSFAQKAQMYYQKRPELINLVEEFYRMYRALAERYDHVTGELRKNLPSPSSLGKLSCHVFGQSTDATKKEEDGSSSSADSASDSDAGSDSDRSSATNYFSGLSGDQALTRRIADLEMELREAKQKLLVHPEINADDPFDQIAMYERELGEAKERLQISEEENARLKTELQSYRKSETPNDAHLGVQHGQDSDDADTAKVQLLEEELRNEKVKLQKSEEEVSHLKNELKNIEVSDEKVRSLQHEVESAQKETSTYKTKLDGEKKEVGKLQERMGMLKRSLQDRDCEIRALKTAVYDAEEKIFPEKVEIKAEMSKVVEERRRVEEKVKELETRGRKLEEEVRRMSKEKGEMREELEDKMEGMREEVVRRDGKIEEMERHMEGLHMEQVRLMARMDEMRGRAKELEEEVERQRMAVFEGAEQKREAIRQLCLSLDHYRGGYVSLRRAIIGHKRLAISAS